MKIRILVCWLIIVQVSAGLAQQNREEKLQQLKNRGDLKVIEVKPYLLKFEFPDGKTIYKNIGDYKPQTNKHPPIFSPTYDSTIIDLRFIDTTQYYHMYSYWTEVPMHNWNFDYVRIGDVNRNNKPELYGSRKLFSSNQEPITIYELDDYETFDFKYQYDSVIVACSIYDVDKDGNDEVLLTKTPIYSIGNQQRYFSKQTETSFATELNFIFNLYNGAQLDDQTLGNFDADSNTELIFARSGWPDIHIFEYNPITNNFDSVYRFEVNEPAPYGNAGFSIGDFDLDGKVDIVFGTGRGNVFVIENEGDNQYTNSWAGSVESNHAYIHSQSNDIDGNGKPEFWVLADAYYNGIGITRITIFETNGDSSYQAVGRVDLVGVFSFYAGTMQAVDIDNDGIEEIAICIDDNFLILKFNGSRDHQTYKLYYIKQNELGSSDEYQVYVGATEYDLLNTGKFEILISMYHTKEIQPSFYQTRYLTKIYRPDSTSGVIKDGIQLPINAKLYQSYPNPFNPSTQVKFVLNESINVTLKIFDILGKEIKLLVNSLLPSGEYSIQWDGKDNEGYLLPGGVYFIQMIAGGYRHTIKSVLLK